MGNSCGEQSKSYSKTLKVLNLNYCALATSPFEFYISEYKPQMEKIGEIFHRLCKVQLPCFYQVKKSTTEIFGNLELYFKTLQVKKNKEDQPNEIESLKSRYSPLFNKNAGIKSKINEQSGSYQYYVQTEEQFYQKWEQSYEYQCQENHNKKLKKQCQLLKSKSLKSQDSQDIFNKFKSNLKKYDFLVLKSLLQYVYGKNNYTTDGTLLTDKIDRYFRILNSFFEFSFLDQERKISQFKFGFIKTNPDLYFLHEISDELITFLKKNAKRNYIFFHNQKQLIIIKKQSFTSENESFKPLSVQNIRDIYDVDEKMENPDDESANKIFIVQSNHFLFLAVHLTSRREVNAKQNEYLKSFLNRLTLMQKYKHKHVIAGCDLNSFQSEYKKYQLFPTSAQDITTFKERTELQAQVHKINQTVKKSIDKIITNGNIREGSITLIDGTKPELQQDYAYNILEPAADKQNEGLKSKIKNLLPNDSHPFDQFLVQANIQIFFKENDEPINQIVE